MKKIIALVGAVVIGCTALFADGCCRFSNEYRERALYNDVCQYLDFWYTDLSEEIKNSVCEDVLSLFLSTEMEYEEALANCIESCLISYR